MILRAVLGDIFVDTLVAVLIGQCKWTVAI